MSYVTLAMSVVLSVAVCAIGGPTDDSNVFGEVEITRGEMVSELSIFLVNDGSTEFRFPTGAIGAGEDVQKGQIAGAGTGIKAIPQLVFERVDGLKHSGSVVFLPKWHTGDDGGVGLPGL